MKTFFPGDFICYLKGIYILPQNREKCIPFGNISFAVNFKDTKSTQNVGKKIKHLNAVYQINEILLLDLYFLLLLQLLIMLRDAKVPYLTNFGIVISKYIYISI